MNQLKELLLYKSLSFKQSAKDCGDTITDHLIDRDHEAVSKLQLKNVCAKLAPELADRLEQTCSLLSISKRRFIESALIHALDEADLVMKEINIFSEEGDE
mgnify:CR=1 FL=1